LTFFTKFSRVLILGWGKNVIFVDIIFSICGLFCYWSNGWWYFVKYKNILEGCKKAMLSWLLFFGQNDQISKVKIIPSSNVHVVVWLQLGCIKNTFKKLYLLVSFTGLPISLTKNSSKILPTQWCRCCRLICYWSNGWWYFIKYKNILEGCKKAVLSWLLFFGQNDQISKVKIIPIQ
jgi:hypothetical protein